MDAIGQLTGGIAHDFNNLLTIVIGSSETLIEQLDNPQQQKLAELILQAAEHGGELTRQLLAFARRQPLAPQPFDVNALLDSMAPLITRTLGANLDFSIDSREGELPAFADPAQTEAAILNLCLNARDAMPDGGKLTISTAVVYLSEDQARPHGEALPGDYVQIRVSDTGSGINPDLRDRIFEPFFTTKETGRGTGLGLSMVYGFVQQSRGWLDLNSEPGKGTSFSLFLPVADADTIALPDDDGRMVERGSENVLIVEDNEMVREHARSLFESLGYHVTVASTGAEAMTILEGQAEDIDLLFTDIVMPGNMNGRQLGERAVARWPSLRVLYTSGYSEDALSKDGRLLEDVTLLSKPYSKQELSEKARKVLDEVP
jgi:CheY-like chemotaxis protein